MPVILDGCNFLPVKIEAKVHLGRVGRDIGSVFGDSRVETFLMRVHLGSETGTEDSPGETG